MAGMTGPAGFVYAVDSTPAMITKGEGLARKLGISNIEFIPAGLDRIPLEDNTADLIISNCVINHVADKDKVWSEIFRLLRPGGRFVISDIYSLEPVPEKYSSDPGAVAECWAGSVTRSVYMESVEKAGFGSIEIIEESKPYEKGRIKVCSFTLRGVKRI
jgi:arsenite methyltransferase